MYFIRYQAYQAAYRFKDGSILGPTIFSQSLCRSVPHNLNSKTASHHTISMICIQDLLWTTFKPYFVIGCCYEFQDELYDDIYNDISQSIINAVKTPSFISSPVGKERRKKKSDHNFCQKIMYHFFFLLQFDHKAFKTCKNTIKLSICVLHPCQGLLNTSQTVVL